MTPGSANQPDTPASSATRIIRGVMQLGRGDKLGIAAFRNTPEALLAAIAPSAALFIVLALSTFVQGYNSTEITKVLILVSALLTRLVVSQYAARFWSREALWPRYATALLWSSWLPMVLSLIVICVMQLLMPGMATSRPALAGVMIGVELYELWLAWFVARAGLNISGGKAALLVVLINGAVAALYLIAALLPPHYNALKEIMGPLPKP
ncbi:hypothetical protein [Asaia krungthepensis]|uniref:Yip1 domain-containing protein n=1 Tax=Asaia krungthepensis NRIC 0535 TaxID=1307925 RepID=A0ABQ0Q5U1_9PROT|nr:hypothetical protein [Asaia krungthepensis]GBQ92822.1 hypothetical protein AA0535_2664 [Asaia krungthepensis NRIC 0535]